MPLVLIPIITVIVNDFIKFIVQWIKANKFDIKWMFHSWWMPSGHSAFVSSAMTVTFLEVWPWSIEFMLAAVFWTLVMYDARWIRRKAGYHARVLNKIQDEHYLDEVLWHSTVEVVTWAFFWMIFSFLLWKTWYFVLSNY